MQVHPQILRNISKFSTTAWLQKSVISYLRACLKQEATALNTKTPSGMLVHSLLYCHLIQYIFRYFAASIQNLFLDINFCAQGLLNNLSFFYS